MTSGLFKKNTWMQILLIVGLLFTNLSLFAVELGVPEWAKQVVWYQIFPERFQNGDPSNDPKLDDIKGSWPFDTTSNIQTPPWTDDWYALQPWERDGRGFYFHVQRRRYGGDLQGILDKLDYLQELGINAIYFNPVFESPSLHKYDAAFYHHIDDNFGPDPAGDKKIISLEVPDDPATWQWTAADQLFLKLLQECHQRGIYVIIDGVFNHVGLKFFAYMDLAKKQQQSRFKDWFTVKTWDNPATTENEFECTCWFDIKNMPEIREDEQGFDPVAWKYMAAAIRRWMDPNGDGNPEDGIDGWRLDVAEHVKPVSWRKFRQLVRSINPRAYLTAEVWWEKWPEKMFNAAPWLKGDMFDAVMNYRFAEPSFKFFVNKQKHHISVKEFDTVLATIRNDYPTDANYALQNLYDSHDTERLATMIVNLDRIYGYGSNVKDSPDFKIRRPNALEIKIQKLMVLFQMTYLGAPMVYYGDEAGMWGANDPDERKPMLWADLAYEPEKQHPHGKKRPIDENKFNQDLFDFYKTMISIRKKYPAFMLGDFSTILTDNAQSVYAFKRSFKSNQVVVILNNSTLQQDVQLDLGGQQWFSCLNQKMININQGAVTLHIDGKSGIVLIRQK